jgi:hypothetical protein
MAPPEELRDRPAAPSPETTAHHQQSHRPNLIGRVINRYNFRTAALATVGVLAVVGASDILSNCEGGPLQQATAVGNLGAVLDKVAVPAYQVGIIQGDGFGTSEVISAKYLHVPKVPLLGFISDAINSGLEKLYHTDATAKVKTSVEILLDNKALSLRPYELPAGSHSSLPGGVGVEADVKAGGLVSVLVQKKPTLPDESSGEGIGTRTSDLILGNGDTTQTDNAAIVVAERYFQHDCGWSLLGLGTVGVEKYVQNLFRLDSEFFSGLPGANPALDSELGRLSHEPVHVVFTYEGKPIPVAQLGRYVHNFGPALPDSKNVAALVHNTPGNVKVSRENNGCLSTTTAINQQEALIQQAAEATKG